MVAKGLCVRGELETEQTATHWPQIPVFSSTSFSLFWLLGAGFHSLEPQLKLQLQLTPTHWTLRSTGLYNCLTSTCFLWGRNFTKPNPSTVKVIPWYLRPDAPVIYKGASLIWRLGRGSICNSTWEITDYGSFINQFPPNIIRSTRQFERINKKICWQKRSIIFNQICINGDMLPIYIHI